MSQNAQYLPQVIEIARSAGDVIMEVYRGEIEVQRKHDSSPLTLADMAAHHVIESGLNNLMPKLPVLSEESAAIPYATRATWYRYWLVDPLDGTREFTVNIALIDDGKPVVGVVYAPAKGQLYYASKDGGAFKQDGNQAVQAIHARKLNPADIMIAGSRSHSDARMQTFLSNVAGNLSPPKLISIGSSLKICLVAEGVADVYPRLGPTSEWDTAAAQCVLEQAGGQLSNMNGVPFCYNAKESLLNPEFFACGATPHAWNHYLE